MEQETKGDSWKILSDSDATVDKSTISWRLYHMQPIIAQFNCANIEESNTRKQQCYWSYLSVLSINCWYKLKQNYRLCYGLGNTLDDWGIAVRFLVGEREFLFYKTPTP
jgi:hypothetical protein